MIALEVALRTVLAAVFAVAFIGKVRSRAAFSEFASSLSDITWLTGTRRRISAAAIPAAELAVVLLLALPWAVSFGFGLGVLVLAAFTSVTGSELAKGRQVRCRCFGASGGQIGLAQIVRNVVLLALSLAGLVIEPVSHGGVGAAGLIVAFGLALVAAVGLVRWDDLASLARTS
jgi:hypothetical protein